MAVNNIETIVIGCFESMGKFVEISPPLELAVKITAKQNYSTTDIDFCLHEISPTLEALREDVLDWLDMLWVEYANGDADEMTPGAIELKQRLLERMREIS